MANQVKTIDVSANDLNEVTNIKKKINKQAGFNLLDPYTFRYGKFFFSYSKDIQDGENYGLTDYIPANPLGLITEGAGVAAQGLSSYVVYDEAKTPLRNLQGNRYTYEEGDGFVVFCYFTGGDLSFAENLAVVVGTLYAFEPFSEYKPLTDLKLRVDEFMPIKKDLPTLLQPKKIYTVFNDLKGTGTEDLYNVRMYSAPIYFDNMLKDIDSDLDTNFEETGNEVLQVFPPEITTETKSDILTKKYSGLSNNGGSLSFIRKTTKESVGKSITPKILSIGDSVTAGYLSSVGLVDSAKSPSQFWSVIKEQFEQAKIDGGDLTTEHNAVLVGRFKKLWSMNYGGVTDRIVKAYCEGVGGWRSSTHMFWSKNWELPESQGMWDLLGLGNGSGTDYISANVETIMTTPEGKNIPKDTPAFLAYIQVNLDAGVTTYAEAVAALDALEANPINPFYDKTMAQTSSVAFSLKTYLDRYKTLDFDGSTRLIVGNTAGSEVTNSQDYDVVLPTHIILQHSHNDENVSWIGTNYRLWTNSIKSEYVANGWGDVKIGISIIPHTGTYYPKRYPMFERESISKWNYNDGVGYDNLARVISEFWIDDANEDTEGIFILPSLHVFPPAWSTPFRKTPSPAHDITGIENNNFRVIDGAGPDYHPNSIAHRNWGIQMYAWIKYTLSL